MKKIIIICILVFSISACTPFRYPLEKRLENNDIPKYNGYISPIDVPIQPMYSPVTFDYNYSKAIKVSVNEGSKTFNETEYIEISGRTKIAKLGDLLTWDMSVNKMTIDRKTISHDQNLFEVRMLTDKFGEIQEVEITAPALIAQKVEQKIIEEIIATTRESMKMTTSVLPKNPVRSGEYINKLDINSFLKEIHMAYFGKDIGYKITGWSYFNNNKVILASIDEILDLVSTSGQLTGDILTFTMKINGYVLIDPESFQIIDQNLFTEMNGSSSPPPGHRKMSVKWLEHMSSKLK